MFKKVNFIFLVLFFICSPLEANLKEERFNNLLINNTELYEKYLKINLNLAIANENLENIKIILKKGATKFLKEENNYYLHWAVILKNEDLLNIFLENGANINTLKQSEDALYLSPLVLACKKDNEQLAWHLIEKGADIKAGEEMALYWAVENKMYKMAEFLLTKGLDVNKNSFYGRSTFQNIFYNSATETTALFNLLLKHGAKVNSRAENSLKAALHFAALRNSEEKINWLLKNKANIEIKDAFGFTPLLLAVFSNNKEAVLLLIENGADVNAVNNGLESGLHLSSNLEIIKILVENGANVKLRDKNNKTPLDKFGKEEFSDIKVYLEKNRAKTFQNLK